MEKILAAPFAMVWWLAGPITYIVTVVDTWQGRTEVWLKILISLTLDAFLAVIWPVTWVLWIVFHMMGNDTPLRTVLGF